jgi:hypothetical protein
MKFLEVVIASNGENLSWAKGMQDIIIEYSTSKQLNKHKQRHADMEYKKNISNLNNIRDYSSNSFSSFLSGLKKDIKFARSVSKEIDEVLSLTDKDQESSMDLLSGHRVVQIENNPNMCEANQYLTHIITNYDNLSAYTVFTQGYPHDHVSDIKSEIIKNIGNDFSTLPSSKIRSLGESDHELLARQFGEMVTGKKINKSIWSAGSCFMASKSAILKNDISWYKNILDKGDSFKDSKFAIERLWSVLLSPNEDWS